MSALSGITVLELSRVLAGPWCGMILADLGADVIKLESFDGDDTRGLGPPFLDGMSAYFACCNRNKRSLAIDLRAHAARPLLEALVREADVLVENYRTGGAESLGVGYEELAAINPRLVYCSISGYGREGPGAQLPGYDYVVQAEAGLMSVTGPSDGEPYKVGVAVADLSTGQNAATAILAALLQRHHSGKGQRIDVSLFDSQLALLANVGSNALFTGGEAARYGNAHASIVPYEAFRARDGEFVLAVASENSGCRPAMHWAGATGCGIRVSRTTHPGSNTARRFAASWRHCSRPNRCRTGWRCSNAPAYRRRRSIRCGRRWTIRWRRRAACACRSTACRWSAAR